VVGHVGLEGLPRRGYVGEGLEALPEILEDPVGPPPVDLAEPPEGERVPGHVDAALVHRGQSRQLPRARVAAQEHGAGGLPDGLEFRLRVEGHAPSVEKPLPVIPEIRLRELGAADGEDVEEAALPERAAPAEEKLHRLAAGGEIGAKVGPHEGRQAPLPAVGDAGGEAVAALSKVRRP